MHVLYVRAVWLCASDCRKSGAAQAAPAAPFLPALRCEEGRAEIRGVRRDQSRCEVGGGESRDKRCGEGRAEIRGVGRGEQRCEV